jgi:hypothetical protein
MPPKKEIDMQRKTKMSLVLVPIAAIAAALLSGAASPAMPSDTPSKASQPEDARVKAWKEKIVKDSKGSARFASADLVEAPDPKAKAVNPSRGLTAGIASNCTLQVVVYKDYSAGTWATSSSLVSCSTSPFGTLMLTAKLFRLDWWGFNLRFQKTGRFTNRYSGAISATDYCRTGDYNTWSGQAYAQMWRSGSYYTATVSSSANINCGGS